MSPADATPTERIFTVRPITARLPAVSPTRATRVPLAGEVARAADLLDRHVSGRLDKAGLLAGLHATVWPRLPRRALVPAPRAGSDIDRWRGALERAFWPVLEQLAVDAAPFLRAAGAEPDVCDRGCTPAEVCPWHRRLLGDWWDVLHAAAKVTTDKVPARALVAVTGAKR